MKWWEKPSLSLIPSVWSQQYRLEVVDETPTRFGWFYNIVCDCCEEVKFEGYSFECEVWLNPMFFPHTPN